MTIHAGTALSNPRGNDAHQRAQRNDSSHDRPWSIATRRVLPGRSCGICHSNKTAVGGIDHEGDQGSWAVAADQGQGSQELHVVYASPGTITAYRRDGHFPDGTVLVKEVHFAATGLMTTGTISHADKLRGWFVMVKDSLGRYPGNNMWGDGWGWGWFDAANPSTPSRSLPLPDGVEASLDYRENCKSCHLPAQATGWIYVDGYPPLKR